MTKLPHEFKRIRLNLARSKQFPAGSDRHGYEFVAPLDADGHIDLAQWQKHRANCGVRRFWDGEEEYGRLIHKPGGAEHSRWVFHYGDAGATAGAMKTTRPDTASVPMRSGPANMSSIRGEDEELHTFQVVSVEPAS